MRLQSEHTVPNVRDVAFTAADRRRALQVEASQCEYTTTEPVRIGEYIIAKVVHDADAASRYELPLSFGRVADIRFLGGDASDVAAESIDPNDTLCIEWFQPSAAVPSQRYDKVWVLKAAEGDAMAAFSTSIERGCVVLAGITSNHLIARSYLPGGRVLIKCRLGAVVKRKLAELPELLTQWSKYGQ